MGIDAEMFCVVTGDKPSQELLLRLSWDLCRAIGPKHFFIESGLQQADYEVLSAKWHEAFRAHPLYPLFNKKQGGAMFVPDNTDYRSQIVADIGEFTFKEHRQALDLTNSRYPIEPDETDIPVQYHEPGKCWQQDGDPMLAGPNEWFIQVHLWGRYYGPEYERGDILTYCAIAEWLEVNMPNIKAVYYGGDSSGVLAEKFDNDVRVKLRQHLYSPRGRDYFKHSAGMPSPMSCSLCVPNESRCVQYGSGSGGQYQALHCAGCGNSFETRDSGANWKVLKEND